MSWWCIYSWCSSLELLQLGCVRFYCCIFRFILVVILLEGTFFIVSLFINNINRNLSVHQSFQHSPMDFFVQVIVAQNDLFPSCHVSSSSSHSWRHCWLCTSSFPPFLRETLVLLLLQVCSSSWLWTPLQHLGWCSAELLSPTGCVCPSEVSPPFVLGSWQSRDENRSAEWVPYIEIPPAQPFPSVWPLWLHSRTDRLFCLLQPFL